MANMSKKAVDAIKAVFTKAKEKLNVIATNQLDQEKQTRAEADKQKAKALKDSLKNL